MNGPKLGCPARWLWTLVLLLVWGCEPKHWEYSDEDFLGTPNAAASSTPGDGTESWGPCDEDLLFFESALQEPVLGPICAGCHSPEGVAGSTAFVLTTAAADSDWLNVNFERATALALVDGPGSVPLLLQKPSGQHPDGHGGQAVLVPGSDAYAAMETFVARARGERPCPQGPEISPELCQQQVLPGRRLLRRLTAKELSRTLADLLFAGQDQVLELSSDPMVRGFVDASSLTVTPLWADQVRSAAESLSDKASASYLDFLVPCDPAEGLSCAERFVRSFGQRAFRRPLSEGDVGRYLGLFVEAAGDQAFRGGVRWTIAAMLQSPHFLYRSELGAAQGDGTFRLSGWEIASELSYLVWGTMPDEDLFTAASRGDLDTPEGRNEHLVRLLVDPRAEAHLSAFFFQWLGLDRLPVVVRDPERYPELTPSVREAMHGESSRLLVDAFRKNGSLDDLLLAEHTFVNDELAIYYGVPSTGGTPDAEGFRKVDVTGTGYGGLLTQGALMTSHALPDSSSPIHRGLMVRERLLCQDLPEPPANLDTSPPPIDDTMSTRERYAEHASVPQCASCHQMIDGIGFGFEHFDAVGRFRTLDDVHPVDARGTIHHGDGRQEDFEGLSDLASYLANDDAVEACMSEHWHHFATGLASGGDMACTSLALREGVMASEGRFTALYGVLVQAPHFTLRRGGELEADAPAAGALVSGPAMPSGELPTTPEAPSLSHVVETSEHGPMYCIRVTVVNETSEPLVWELELELPGTLEEPWSALVTDLGEGLYRFWGVGWNAELPPHGNTEFGVCGNYEP